MRRRCGGAVEWGFVVASGCCMWCTSSSCCAATGVADLTGGGTRWRGSGPFLSSLVAIAAGSRFRRWSAWARAWWRVFLIAGGPDLLRAAHDLLRASGAQGHRLRVAHGAFIASYTVVDGYAVKDFC